MQNEVPMHDKFTVFFAESFSVVLKDDARGVIDGRENIPLLNQSVVKGIVLKDDKFTATGLSSLP